MIGELAGKTAASQYENQMLVMLGEMKKKIGYVYSEDYIRISSLLPSNKGRSEIVHRLIEAYGLMPDLVIVAPRQASKKGLALFHDEEYIQALLEEKESEIFGLEQDCPVFEGLRQYVILTAGAALEAANSLLSGEVDVCFHLQGGRHHAKSDEASGFCYVNDICLSILQLRKRFARIACIDLDIHHGDGTESAFYFSNQVLTVSLHRYCAGFYPGTGSIEDIGKGPGKFYNLNLPMERGLSDENLKKIFETVWSSILHNFKPEAVVLVSGADGLAGDPHKEWNLTEESFEHCLELILSESNLPCLILGGGGYHHPNTARCWTKMLASALGKKVSEDIPEHKYLHLYEPSFSLKIEKTSAPDLNTESYITKLKQTQCIAKHMSLV